MLIQPRSEEDHKNIIEQGFTLVELLIVIVILGILAGIVVFAVGGLTEDASKNACQTDASTFTSAYQAFKAHNTGTAPTATSAQTVLDDLTGDDDGGPYLQSEPSTVDKVHSLDDMDPLPAIDDQKWAFDITNGKTYIASCG